MRELNEMEIEQVSGGYLGVFLAGGTGTLGIAVSAGVALGYAIDYGIDCAFGTHLVS